MAVPYRPLVAVPSLDHGDPDSGNLLIQGELVLDSFLGSGTTAAVAHKMGRRWIGIELGGHAQTHCAARLRKVIDGEQGGISGAVGWQGGGGLRFCRLGEPVFDGQGSIRPGVGFADLARWVWYRETRQPLALVPDSPLLGMHWPRVWPSPASRADNRNHACQPRALRAFSIQCGSGKSRRSAGNRII